MKTILITGASSGIGAALALYYASNHKINPVRLCLGGRNPERLAAVAAQCVHYGADVHFHAVDVTDRDIMHHWVVDCDKRFSVDIIIANAGISGGILDVSGAYSNDMNPTLNSTLNPTWPAKDYAIFDTNLIGVLNTIIPIIPRFQARQAGHIVLISSLASYAPWPGAPAYAASKAAVRFYGEALTGTLSSDHIAVTTICPGFIKTPLTDVNPFPMPFILDADKAALKIARAICARRVRYSFPFFPSIFAQFLGLIPPPIIQWILKHSPKKP